MLEMDFDSFKKEVIKFGIVIGWDFEFRITDNGDYELYETNGIIVPWNSDKSGLVKWFCSDYVYKNISWESELEHLKERLNRKSLCII